MAHLLVRFQKREKKHLKLLLVFLATIFLTGCNEEAGKSELQSISQEEKMWMEKFFTDVMLDESAIYTLFGSKPMTTITLSYHSDEEVQSYFDQLSQEEKEAAVVVDDYDLPQNWDKWEKIQSEFKKNRFLFFRKIDPEDPKFATLYFVDLVKIALLLEEHYDVFKKETGLDFHPLQAGLEIESGSVFWDKVFDNSALVGLLYGFGVKNSFSFKWKYGECAEINKRFCQSLHSHFSDEPAYGKTNIAHFRLPIFASFSEEDEMIEKYKKERDEIKRRYQKKDFLITTLQKLASQ